MRSHVLNFDWSLGKIEQVYRPLMLRPVDLTFADPPYNLGVEYEDDDTHDKVSHDEYRSFVVRTLHQILSVTRPGGLLWWLAPVSQLDWLPAMLTGHFGPRLHSVVWYETFAQYQQRTLTGDFRMLLCHRTGVEGHVTFNGDDIRIQSERQRIGDKRADPRGRVPGSVWRIRRLQGTAKDAVDWHPNQIPPELLERIVRGWTNPGDIVMDAFAGSGSLGVQCGGLLRHFIGVDKSWTYCMKMKERIDASMAS